MRPDMAKVIVERPRIGSELAASPKVIGDACSNTGPMNFPLGKG